MAAPFFGTRMVELTDSGPGPFCARLLAGLGAGVIRVDRPPHALGGLPEFLNFLRGRGKRSVVIDLEAPRRIGVVPELIERMLATDAVRRAPTS